MGFANYYEFLNESFEEHLSSPKAEPDSQTAKQCCCLIWREGLFIITKRFILDFVAVLDPPLMVYLVGVFFPKNGLVIDNSYQFLILAVQRKICYTTTSLRQN